MYYSEDKYFTNITNGSQYQRSLGRFTDHLIDVFQYIDSVGVESEIMIPNINESVYSAIDGHVQMLQASWNDKYFFDSYIEVLWSGADQLSDLFSQINNFSSKYLGSFETYNVHDVPIAGANANYDSQADYFNLKPKKRKRSNLPKQATKILESWILMNVHNPYPREEEKRELCKMTFLSSQQLSNWFINARRRILPKLKLKYSFSTY